MVEKFLKKSFEKVINLLDNNQLKNGHNGPYRDKETNVREISHLLVFYSNIIKSNIYTDNSKIKGQLIKLKDALINNENYRGEAYFKFRIKPGKDEVNGVIGVAWVLEGLCASYEVLKDKEILVFLEKIISSIKFNSKRSLWERPTLIFSDESGVDETYNHQLWLAYGLVYYAKISSSEILPEVKLFFEKTDSHLNIHKNGLIVHALRNKNGFKNKLKTFLKQMKIFVSTMKNSTSTKYKEEGYHMFSMYAFARISYLGFESLFNTSIKFQKSLKYLTKEELYIGLSSNAESSDYYSITPPSGLIYNRYGFPYNVSGFEFLYVNEIFNLKKEVLSKKYLKSQLDVYGFDVKTEKFDNNVKTEDITNLFLRVYELSFYICIRRFQVKNN